MAEPLIGSVVNGAYKKTEGSGCYRKEPGAGKYRTIVPQGVDKQERRK